jgi:dTDP-4-amino-4,6-dideoxygalactose transaminase
VTLADSEVEAALDALSSGWLTMGPRIQAFEAAAASHFGVKHALALSSGTAALHLACVAAGVSGGAKAVVSALAGPEAAWAPRSSGGEAIAVDVQHVLLPAADLAEASNPDARAVIASHPAGVPLDAPAIRAACDARGILMIEDATDALGATLADDRPAGSAGHMGCFSLGGGRLGDVGEGGIFVTDDDEFAARVKSLRSHAMTSVTWDRHRGHADSYDIVDIGFNYRMDEPRAALATARFERLGELVRMRLAAAETIRAALPAGVTPAWPEGLPTGSAPQAVALVAADERRRDALVEALGVRGLTARSWPSLLTGAAPVAAEARARTVLVDLGAVEAAGLDASTVAEIVAAA